MSYTLVGAIGKPRAIGARWVSVELGDVLCHQLYQDYRKLIVELDHPTLTDTVILSLEDVQPLLSDKTITFNDWLISLGNASLPTQAGDLTLTKTTARFYDGWRAGLTIQPTRMGTHPDAAYTASEKRDLLISGRNEDYPTWQDYCLVTVNGLIHQTSSSGHGLYVVDGAFQDKHTHLGIIDFSTIGKLQCVPLTVDMLYRPHEDNRYYQQAYLDLGVPTENKYVFIVMGGYLHLYDQFYQMIGDGLVKLDFNRYPMIQRYYESRHLIDLSSVALSEIATDDDESSQRSVEELLRQDSTVEAMVGLSQSFAVVVDADDLYFEKTPLEKTPFPGTFLSHQAPSLPLMAQRGKLKEYWSREDHGQWVINIDTSLVPHYQFEESGYEGDLSVTDHVVPGKPYRSDRAFWLEIGRER